MCRLQRGVTTSSHFATDGKHGHGLTLSYTQWGIRVGVNVADPLSRAPSEAALALTKITTIDRVHGQIFA
jgi:hypothetical protein